MDTPSRVVVIGSINVDLFARVRTHPRPGETVLGEDGSRKAGGKGANQAVAAALAGAPTAMVGCIGEDSAIATSLLEKAGVDLSGVRRVEDTPTGIALITVSDAGENSIIVIPGANAQVTVDDVRAAALTAEDVVVVQGEIPTDVVDEAARVCTDLGTRLVVNLAPVVALAPDTLRAADPLIVNEHEARAAAAMLEADDPAAADDDMTTEDAEMTLDEASALGESLRAHGVDSVVITLGAAGAVVSTSAGTTVCEGEKVEVVDTTGAGDCFVGTVAARLAEGDSLEDAARAGNAAAAKAVQRAGAQESYAWPRC
ncbi:ribokinase [Mobilicoccus massiliensis]|uniref:ribokinase n=1 Tax=Mobilicoccus massiliensis TaxID=1522310 RepID=UPI000590FF12|nr:ribokinase [Mobilicoccus massiliensis]